MNVVTEPEDDFYIGYKAQAPPVVMRRMRVAIAGLAVLGLSVAASLAATQAHFGNGVFEFGLREAFEGRVDIAPYPALLVDRPGGQPSRYLLVAPGKHGAEKLVSRFDGQRVRLEGSLVYRAGMTMIELAANSIQVLEDNIQPKEPVQWFDPEARTFEGEIVDSKCYLGVMKPGSTKPHRGCATRCLSGGIPPVLLVRDEQGNASYLLLASPEGAPIGRDIVERDLVAEPVRVVGSVQRLGEWYVLRTDPASIERLADIE